MKILKRLLLISFLFIILITPSRCAVQQKTLQEFGGMVDIIPSDKIADKYTPDCLNISLSDKLGTITKRKGYINGITAEFGGLRSIRNLYSYEQVDGDKYIIAVTSTSIMATKDLANNLYVKQGLTNTWQWDFATGKDTLFCCSNSTTPIKWDGTTATWLNVLNSTGMVSGKFCKYWNNRLFISGIDGQESTVWFSEVNDPQNIQAVDYVLINANDGQKITGMFVFDNQLWVFKTYSIYTLSETTAGNFLVRQVSKEIGALYNSAIAEYKGALVWLSHRGVEGYTGEIKLISENVDNFFKSLNQLNPESLSISQTSATDWGAGTEFVNVDTTTTSGSVSAEKAANEGVYYETEFNNLAFDYDLRQTFYSTNTCYTDRLIVELIQSVDETNTFEIKFLDYNYSLITSSIITLSGIHIPEIRTIPFTKTRLAANSTYYIELTTGSAWSLEVGLCNTSSYYPRGSLYQSYYNLELEQYEWIKYIDYYGLLFNVYLSTPATSSFSSMISTATDWASWGSISINETKPSGSTISYYVKTSTANDNFSTRPGIPVSNGSAINSTVGGYIQVVTSITRTISITEPRLDSLVITYYGTSNNYPQMITYKDNLWVSVSTDTSQNINDVVMIYDKYGNWLKYNNIYMGSATLYRNRLYTGSSQNTGMVYLQDVANTYTDSIGSYDAYYTTKVMDFEQPYYEKIFKDLIITANSSGNWDLDIGYRLDGEDGAWTDKSLNLYSATNKIISQRIPLSLSTKGRQIQLRFRNNTADEYFELRRLDLLWDAIPPR